LILLLRIRAGAQDRRAIFVKQMEIVDGRKELLRREGFVGKNRARTIGRNQIKRVTRENDLSTVGKQQDKINVEDSKLCVGGRKIELELCPRRHLHNAHRTRRRTVNGRNDALYWRERNGCGLHVVRRLRQHFGFSFVRLSVSSTHTTPSPPPAKLSRSSFRSLLSFSSLTIGEAHRRNPATTYARIAINECPPLNSGLNS
jgi:hypothetical protein